MAAKKKGKGQPTTPATQPGSVIAGGADPVGRTSWHPILVAFLRDAVDTSSFRVEGEVSLHAEPLRVDAVIERLVDDTSWNPPLADMLLGDLTRYTLIHFKGASDELEREDAFQLLGYLGQFLAKAKDVDAYQVSVRVLASDLTPRFREALAGLGVRLKASKAGVWEGVLNEAPLRVIEAAVAYEHPGHRLLYWLSRRAKEPVLETEVKRYTDAEKVMLQKMQKMMGHLRATLPRLWYKDLSMALERMSDALKIVVKNATIEERLDGLDPWEIIAAVGPDKVLNQFKAEQRLAGLRAEERLAGLKAEERLAGLDPKQVVETLGAAKLVSSLAPEQRLAGLRAEERLAGLKAEERLAGLDEAEVVLAMPLKYLRLLPAAEIEGLPEHIKQQVKARLAQN